MKRKRYTEEQIAFALRQAESGTLVAEVTRKMGIRLLTLVDHFSRESPAIQVGTRLTGDDVVAALDRVKAA